MSSNFHELESETYLQLDAELGEEITILSLNLVHKLLFVIINSSTFLFETTTFSPIFHPFVLSVQGYLMH